MKRRLLLGLLPCLLIIGACDIVDKTTDKKDDGGTSVSPTPVPTPTPAPTADTVEYRVTGDTSQATIVYGNTDDGMTRVVTALPFLITTKNYRSETFLSLDASGTGFGFLQVQIVVNGVVFRDASQYGADPRVTVSGTYRR